MIKSILATAAVVTSSLAFAAAPNVKFKPVELAAAPNVKFKPVELAAAPNVKFIYA
ncbi:hypothetical protein [Shewanella algae]|uniref:hypothetical protein n=1 Tax=Shewanella algae TaxID=38313 RepID=UPI001F2DACCC|nr:hypothetical protein [Shewanella algae]MCE9778572.1 hypothetical protein [Shewanella algae]MCE9782123.1 hypothetical protein [Shewanella algae]